ncbi:MAG: gliding motility-associated C-terminal domain-containing protein [Bacteroidetes bacterium]|nr:gliding motility-associated C-terminal domain-containing protein [Bacteroidota bacterium]
MNTWEGCATANDANGNLLFYASPEKVWDRNNNVMPNGSGILGGISATQGAAIVHSFSNPNQYYLFCLTEGEHVNQNSPGHLYYSLIDMTLNGGYGDIVAGQKNIILDVGVSEKMVAIAGNGCYTWLVVHKADEPIFDAFKIDATGINPVPVSSTSGFYSGYFKYECGTIKNSPDNKNILLSSFETPTLELHSFNDATGVISNAIKLDSNIVSAGSNYDVEYSSDGSKLYVGCIFADSIAQYDLSFMPNIIAVRNSKFFINVDSPTSGLRRGPDNKIYVCTGKYGTYVSVINSPNVAGAGCNFASNIFGPLQGLYHLSLGNPIAMKPLNVTTHDTSVCFGNSISVDGPPGFDSYSWNDGIALQADTFSAPGTKWVVSKTEQDCKLQIDTFHVYPGTIDINTSHIDTTVCFVNNTPVFTAMAGYDSYLWSDGKTTQQDSMSMPGTKWVRCQTGCTMLVDTFHVHDWRDTTKMVTDTSHCVAYSSIPVVAPGGYTSYLWSDGKTTQADTFFSTSTKWATALNGCNMLIDTVHFTATTIPQDSVFEHNTDSTICFEARSVTVNAPGGYTLYLWSDGITTQGDVFNNAATKWVYAQKLCYLLIDTFSVLAKPTDTLMDRVDTIICFSSGVTLSTMSGYDTYLWSDGNADIADTFSQTSVKRVYAHRACEERIDTFHVQFINDLSVDLGADTAICKGESVQLNATSTYNTAKYLWQDGKTTSTYAVTEGGDYSVKVSVGPCIVGDTIRVHQKVIDIKLKNAEIPCHEESVTLDAGVDNASYLWQDGSTNRTYKATKEGSYSVKVTQDECSATASVTVRFEGCPCNVVIPTAFSPNNDGRNDKFGLTVSCVISSFKLMVYNRWGNQVFYSEDVNQKWDGTCKGIAEDGDVFNYYLEFKDGDNKTYNYKGNVTLVR